MNAVAWVYHFRGLHGCESKCGLRILTREDGRVVVICSELPDNPGTSVTNFVEELAGLVCVEYRIHPTRLVWIEHYVSHRRHPKPDWDLVTFKSVSDGRRAVFFEPQWRPMRVADWRELGLPMPGADASLGAL